MKNITSPIKSIPLHRWLPVGATLAILFMMGIFAMMDIRQRLEETEQRAVRTIYASTAQLSTPIRRALESTPRDNNHLKVLISSLALNDDIDISTLTDEKQSILEANHYAWRGKRLPVLIPSLPRVHRDMRDGELEIIPQEDKQLGILAIRYTPPGANRANSRTALLWLFGLLP